MFITQLQRNERIATSLLVILTLNLIPLKISASRAVALQTSQSTGGPPELVLQIQHDAPVSSVAFSPDGQMLASASADRIIRLWDAQTGKLIRTLEGLNQEAYSVAFSPDGKIVTGSAIGGALRIWDTQTGALKQELTNIGGAVSFSPDGKMLAYGNKNKAILLDLQTWKPLRALDGPEEITSVASHRTPRCWRAET